jgi:hypothetical protein
MHSYDNWKCAVLEEPFRPMPELEKQDIYEVSYILPTPQSVHIRSLLAENIKLRQALLKLTQAQEKPA